MLAAFGERDRLPLNNRALAALAVAGGERVLVVGGDGAPGNLRNNSMFLPWKPAGGKDTLSVIHQGTALARMAWPRSGPGSSISAAAW